MAADGRGAAGAGSPAPRVVCGDARVAGIRRSSPLARVPRPRDLRAAHAGGAGGRGEWSSAGRLLTSREFHPATALPDGRVLVSGGFSFSGIQASAELFDPATRRWQNTFPMSFGALCAHVDAARRWPRARRGRSEPRRGLRRRRGAVRSRDGGVAACRDGCGARGPTTPRRCCPTGACSSRAGWPAATPSCAAPRSTTRRRTRGRRAASMRFARYPPHRDDAAPTAGCSSPAATAARTTSSAPPRSTTRAATAGRARRACGARAATTRATLLPDGRVLVAGGGARAPGFTKGAEALRRPPRTAGSRVGNMKAERGVPRRGAAAERPGARGRRLRRLRHRARRRALQPRRRVAGGGRCRCAAPARMRGRAARRRVRSSRAAGSSRGGSCRAPSSTARADAPSTHGAGPRAVACR